VGDIVSKVGQKIPGKNLGIHAHNDTENAVANSLAAVLAGVRQIQGTINGLGERCGNANLISLIPSLVLKKSLTSKFEIKINKDKIKTITEYSRLLDEILNRKSDRSSAYVGPSAFAHKGGLHVSAVSKDPKTYEHIEPSLVGNVRNIIISDKAGKSNMNIIAKDAAMALAGTKKQMGGFEFPDAATMKSKYMNKGGILMKYLNVMGNMFATSENPALKNYSKVVDTSYLPN